MTLKVMKDIGAAECLLCLFFTFYLLLVSENVTLRSCLGFVARIYHGLCGCLEGD